MSKNFGQTHCFNEKYFEDFFAARGFQIVAPEKLTVEEQLSLVTGAKEFVTTLGTLSHWAIFCNPDTKIITLNRTHNSATFQFLVNEAVGFSNYYSVDVSKDYISKAKGVCMLGSTKYWKEFVADYFGENIGEDDDAPYFDDALNKFINFWCQKYCNPESKEFNLEILINTLKEMCNHIISLESASLEAETLKNRPLLTYQTHVSHKGWCEWKIENQPSNSFDKEDIQAIKINFPDHKVYYAVYFNEEEGWSTEVSDGEQAGTTGKSKAIFGIKIRLDEAGAKEFDILYRIHKFDGEWTDWAKNGEELFSNGQKINVIHIKLIDSL